MNTFLIVGNPINDLFRSIEENNLIGLLNNLAFFKPELNKPYDYKSKKEICLHFACANSTKEIVDFLISNGGDLEQLDQDKLKPLERAKRSNNVK